jgi:hypothetical protein
MIPEVPSGNMRRGFAVSAGGFEVIWLLSAIFLTSRGESTWLNLAPQRFELRLSEVRD